MELLLVVVDACQRERKTRRKRLDFRYYSLSERPESEHISCNQGLSLKGFRQNGRWNLGLIDR